MSEALYINLESSFKEFVDAYESKGQAGDETKEAFKKDVLKKKLEEICQCLLELHYSKADLVFAFGVDAQTLERWFNGHPMRAETFNTFAACIRAMLAGKSQRPVRASDTGFVTWRYQVEQEQSLSKRVWYIASSRLLLTRQPAVEVSVTNLFSLQHQKRRAETGLPPLVKVYVYPSSRETASSFAEWKHTLEAFSQEPLCGSIFGIVDDTTPWYMPGVRALVLEKPPSTGSILIEGYLRVRLPDDYKKPLLRALDPLEAAPHTPWLAVHPETSARWFNLCKAKYSALVDAACKEQAERQQPFQVHLLNIAAVK